MLIAALILPVAIIAAGLCLQRARGVAAGEETSWTALESATSVAIGGVSLATLSGLGLAYWGQFGLWSLSIALFLLSLVVWLATPRRASWPLFGRFHLWDWMAMAVAASVIVFAVAYRFHEVEGLRDPGVYVASGIELARTGDLGWHDDTANFWKFPRHLFVDWGAQLDYKPEFERFPGFYLEGNHGNMRIEPQFLHGYEVWLAISYLVGGPQATQCVNGFFAALALLSFYCAVARATDSRTGAIACLLLAANPATLWFIRFPGNEIMVLALVWGALMDYMRLLTSDDHALSPDSKRQPISNDRKRAYIIALLPLVVACLTKFAAWLYLPIIAFHSGMMAQAGLLRVRPVLVSATLAVTALLAYAHAAVFADIYLHGSMKFTLNRAGIDSKSVPILLVAGICAAVSLGALLSEPFRRMINRSWSDRARQGLACVLLAGFVALYLFQKFLLINRAGQWDQWVEQSNIVELSMYFTPLILLLAAVGLACLFTRVSGDGRNGILMLAFSASLILLFRRNIDALHPWAARRWMIMLIPCLCIGLAAFAVRFPSIIRFPEKTRTVTSFIAVILFAGVPLLSQKLLVTTRNYLGVIPHLDILAERLDKDDLILTQETGEILQWGPYLKARHDLDLYKQPDQSVAWSETLRLMRMADSDKHSTIYITGDPVTSTPVTARFVESLGTFTMPYSYLNERLRAVPRDLVHVNQQFHLYQLNPDLFVPGWTAFTTATLELPVARPLPLLLKMNDSANPYIEGFYDTTRVNDDVSFRWTDGDGRIHLGQMIQQPLEDKVLSVTLHLSSGRSEETTFPVRLRLDEHDLERQFEVAEFAITPEWGDYTFQIDASRIRRDSILEIVSQRAPVGNSYPGGVLGIPVQYIKLE